MEQEKNGAMAEEQHKSEKEDPFSSDPIITSFLLLARESGKVDVVVELPGVEKKRSASLRDIRDVCRQVYDDVVITMISGETTDKFHKSFGLDQKIKNA